MSEKNENILQFRIKRWDPRSAKFSIHYYEVPTTPYMTILDALIYIKENIDSTLTFRMSCRMARCGSCAITINGKPGLACNTSISSLNSRIVTLEPLRNLPPIRDLVVDHTPFFKKQAMIKPYLMRRDINDFESEYWNPSREYYQSPKELEEYAEYAYCVTCGACYSACETVALDNQYLGPQALMNIFRFIQDSRDEGVFERLEIIDAYDKCWKCRVIDACSFVCPKNIDISQAIQYLKRYLLKKYFLPSKIRREAAPLASLPPSPKKRVEVQPPPFNV
ncbi:MAG: succinate dehydrogenase/fumarate reductase iron-sulfur subunit [Thaumarchaeota archaeon]|jgi:succinate dehydrogenase / fumarate reductase, iron-sulfur subunit|nr:succinate dehydrogenase/fumarate reductase iron-sulfur subunit [Candidatus Geocrenenecus arthurdayi]MCL7391305.1 succinate dehydrogenase/fumarate reductase iron-sulfur subunit [Candidatus Geocrenenecus arthurdayi]